MRNRKTICIITPGQPSTNPRVVKEADALYEAGYKVHVIYSHWANWADKTDEEILRCRNWTYQCVGGHPTRSPFYYYWTRLRHRALRLFVSVFRIERSTFSELAVGRTSFDLDQATQKFAADLYIGHYLLGLIAASSAARKFQGKLGFDAEDFHSGEFDNPHCIEIKLDKRISEWVEGKYIPECDFLTAASPLIGEAYRSLSHHQSPITILNVFPLDLRPKSLALNDPSNALQLFWFSQSIGEKRGIEDIVRAMKFIPPGKAVLHLMGQFVPGYRQRLHSLIEESGLTEKQFIFHDPIHPDDLVKTSNRYDIGLALEQPVDRNKEICISNKLFVYLLAGNAILATNVLGQRSLAENLGEACRMYTPGDVKSLANELSKWLLDRNALNHARKKAWDLGTSQFNWDREKKKFLGLIDSQFRDNSKIENIMRKSE